MTMGKGVYEILCDNYKQIRSRIEENKLGEAIYLMDSLSGVFKLPASDYDRSDCTPYSDEVTRMCHLGEYVNASFVPTSDTLFIAAQNPKCSKKRAFLELLIKSKVRLVVSLIDDPKYFKEEWLYSRKVVKHMGRDLFADEVYDVKGERIRRLRYLNWIDFSIPTLEEIELLHSYFNDIRSTPVLVHCTAGVGRTGTFIMYDILRRMKSLTLDLFVEVLIELRSRRAHLVVNEVQLAFLKNVFLRN